MPGFSAKGKRPETCRPWHEGQGRLCSSWSCGHGPSPSFHRGKVPVPAAASPAHSPTYWHFHQPDPMRTCQGHHVAWWPPWSLCLASHSGVCGQHRMHGCSTWPNGSIDLAFPHRHHGLSQLRAHGTWAQWSACAPQTACAPAVQCPVLLSCCLPPVLGSGLCFVSSSAVAQPGQHCPCRWQWRYRSLWFTSTRLHWRSQLLLSQLLSGRTSTVSALDWVAVGPSPVQCWDDAVGRPFPGTGSGGRTVPTSHAVSHSGD